MTKLLIVGVLLLALSVPYCSGMVVAPVEGRVTNAVTDQAIAGAAVQVAIKAYIPAPHPVSVELASFKGVTDREGRYSTPWHFGAPKAYLLSGRSVDVSAHKDGFVKSRRPFNYDSFEAFERMSRSPRLVPTEDAVYEELEEIWQKTQWGESVDLSGNPLPDATFWIFTKNAEGYSKARRLATTPRELAFVARFCGRALETFGEFSREDYASLSEYWKTNYSNREMVMETLDTCLGAAHLIPSPD